MAMPKGEVIFLARDLAHNLAEQDFYEEDPGLKAVVATDDEDMLFELIIETNLSETAVREALKKIHQEEMILEIVIEGELSDDLISYALQLISDQRRIMIKIFSLVGEKTIRIRKLAAQRITSKDCLLSISRMESNESIREICKKKLSNICSA